MIKRFTVTIFIIAIISFNLTALTWDDQSSINKEDSLFKFNATVEGGLTAVLLNTYKSGETGTQFNFEKKGGQEILFPFARIEAGVTISDRHLLKVLYQPLEIETQVTFRDDVKINGVTFLDGTPMDLKYGFSFWRFTYGYDFFKEKNISLTAGLALQLRNASIVFSEQSGAQSTTSQNLGLVPALYLGFEYRFPSGIALGFEATGIYASSAIFNGADFDFEGSLLDTSIRIIFPLKSGVDTFVNVRFLGGTSDGVSKYEDLYWTQSIEDYSNNDLATLGFTVGLRIR